MSQGQIQSQTIIKHHEDERSETQQALSNYLVRSLSELNLQRIRDTQGKRKKQIMALNSQYFFLCLTGMPPFQNQFRGLQLPGERMVYTITGFDLNLTYSEEEYLEIFSKISLEAEVDKIRSIIIKQRQKNKRIVLIFHSFNSFLVSYYSHKYKGEDIFGFIDIGGISITLYQSFGPTLMKAFNFEKQVLLENIDFIYEGYLNQVRSQNLRVLRNKYECIIFLAFLKNQEFKNIFSYARNYPNVLKLILMGVKDTFFTQTQTNEKIVHYSYKKIFDHNYEISLREAFHKYYGLQTKNVQERFVINFQEGKHSLHEQPKMIPDLNAAIRQYLTVLDMAFPGTGLKAKL